MISSLYFLFSSSVLAFDLLLSALLFLSLSASMFFFASSTPRFAWRVSSSLPHVTGPFEPSHHGWTCGPYESHALRSELYVFGMVTHPLS